ncbi:Protein kinase superfamily protein [Abeliophyllum distichum]|uniref:Protein kinase superfamily protein n=1 Tax=Abeliophyllum distichum TaxID=126358 RepID=A0ABD1R9J1_9LAMI
MVSSRDVASFLVYFSVFHVFLLKFVDSKCPKSFPCGIFGNLEFPLANYSQPECGLFTVECNAVPHPKVHLDTQWFSPSYQILSNISSSSVRIRNPILEDLLKSKSCSLFLNFSIPHTPSISYQFFPNITLLKCPKNMNVDEEMHYFLDRTRRYEDCDFDFDIYYAANSNENLLLSLPLSLPNVCSVLHLPLKLPPTSDSAELFERLGAEYHLQWILSDDCINCHRKGGQCTSTGNNEFRCEEEKNPLKLILADRRESLLSVSPSSPTQNLKKATNNFDSSKELGDGGFGTVYYGKLRDGREVAIKRLYEHNYKRVEQFINEIKILTCLRHPNLVSLYGCTSRRSRELLLVYEFVSNGTVADHIHGDRAKEAPLSWPIRMNIAIETANALAYLHKSDIIHRDVKTNNILLDDKFCVKVADFGLSRLFPNDVTHISTAPQGTPGYVDPEYHQCYHLTDRSDVYSFGVVLIELISSMPAVDISRHRHEINLANLAISRIQRCAFNELIDSSLGFGSDAEVTRMTTSFAELAFRCLQLEKDMRPSMGEGVSISEGNKG